MVDFFVIYLLYQLKRWPVRDLFQQYQSQAYQFEGLTLCWMLEGKLIVSILKDALQP